MQAQKSETKAAKTAITTHHGTFAIGGNEKFQASAESMASNATIPMAAIINSRPLISRRHSFSLASLRAIMNLYAARIAPAVTITTPRRSISSDSLRGDNHAHPHSPTLKNDIQTVRPMRLFGVIKLTRPAGLIFAAWSLSDACRADRPSL